MLCTLNPCIKIFMRTYWIMWVVFLQYSTSGKGTAGENRCLKQCSQFITTFFSLRYLIFEIIFKTCISSRSIKNNSVAMTDIKYEYWLLFRDIFLWNEKQFTCQICFSKLSQLQSYFAQSNISYALSIKTMSWSKLFLRDQAEKCWTIASLFN